MTNRAIFSSFYPSNLGGASGTTQPSITSSELQTINQGLSNLSNKGLITALEKETDLIPNYNQLESRYQSIYNTTSNISSLSTARSQLNTARTSWVDYLTSLTPAWNDTLQNTAVNRTQFNQKLVDFVSALDSLQTKYAQYASSTATWSEVTGAGKPANNADVTAANISAGFSGQGALATANIVNDALLINTLANRVSPHPNNANFISAQAIAYVTGAGASVDSLKPAEAGANVTESRIASGFTGQGALATINQVDLANHVTGFLPVNRAAEGLINSNILITADGALSGGGGGRVTIGGLGYTGALNATYGGTLGTNIYSSGGTVQTDSSLITIHGIASGITNQGAFATLNSASYGSQFLTGFGGLAPLNHIRLGVSGAGGITNNANTVWLNDTSVITSQGTAAAITGQGPGATATAAQVMNNQISLSSSGSLLGAGGGQVLPSGLGIAQKLYQGNLLELRTWVSGQKYPGGAVTDRDPSNSYWRIQGTGAGAESNNIVSTLVGPSGVLEPVLEGVGGGAYADGGAIIRFGPSEGFDPRKTYRMSVWVRVPAGPNVTALGIYIGTGAGTAASPEGTGVASLPGGSTNTNPYFAEGSSLSGYGGTGDKWLLFIGYVHGCNYTGGHTGLSGFYDPVTGRRADNLGTNIKEYKWISGTTIANFRFFFWTNTTGLLGYFTRPSVTEVEGSSPLGVAQMLATPGADVSVNVFDSTTNAVISRNNLLTSLGTAAAIANQGVFATRSSANWSEVTNASRPLALKDDMFFGSGYLKATSIYETAGTKNLNDYFPVTTQADRTGGATAAGITNQGPFATFNDPATTPAKLQGIQAGADVTALSQIVIDSPGDQIIYRTWQGTPKNGQLPKTLTPIVKRGQTDIRTASDVSYSITTSAGITATVNNTAGSVDKGRITVTAAGAGSLSLTVTVGGVAYGPFAVSFRTVDDAPPVNQGASGGSDSTFALVTSPAFMQITSTDSGETIFTATIASGQKLVGTAPLTYSYSNPNSSGGSRLYAKWQYRVKGSTEWLDFDGDAALGSYAEWYKEDFSQYPGSIECNQQKTGLSAGTYEARLVAAMADGQRTGTIGIDSGTATLSVA